MTDLEILKLLAEQIPDHDPQKCGRCLWTMIEARVAQEYLDASHYEISGVLPEVQKRFRITPIYKDVKALKDEGKSIEDIRSIMQSRGYEDI